MQGLGQTCKLILHKQCTQSASNATICGSFQAGGHGAMGESFVIRGQPNRGNGQLIIEVVRRKVEFKKLLNRFRLRWIRKI